MLGADITDKVIAQVYPLNHQNHNFPIIKKICCRKNNNIYHLNADSLSKQHIGYNYPQKQNNPTHQSIIKPEKTTHEDNETNKLTKPKPMAQPAKPKTRKKKCNSNKTPKKKKTHQSLHNKEQKQWKPTQKREKNINL